MPNRIKIALLNICLVLGCENGAVFARTPPVQADAELAAPPAPPRAPDHLDSPHGTLLTLVTALGERPPDLERAQSCLDLSEVAKDAGPDLVSKLYKCINRIEWIDFEHDSELPTARELERRRGDPVTTFTFFPRTSRTRSYAGNRRYEQVRRLAGADARLTLSRGADGGWRFTAQTVAGIEALWEALSDLRPVEGFRGDEYRTFAERLEGLSIWPDVMLDQGMLGIRYWQWTCLLVLILLGVTLDLVVRLCLRVISRRIIVRRGGVAPPGSLKRTVRPFGLAAAGLLWLFTITLLGLPSDALKVAVPAVKLFAMLSAVWAAYRVTDLVAEVLENRASRTHTRVDDLLVPLVRKTLKVFITAIGLIYIADSFDVEILPLLTGLGVGTLAFGLAAQDSIENFFGSVAVIADRPFEVGDWIQIGDVEGTVEELGFRSTRVRTFYNSLVTVPNATLVRATVDNFGRRKYRRWTTHLSLTYDTPPERIEAFCEGVRELIRVHPYTRKDYYQVWLHQFGAHSLDVLLYLFHEAPDWQTELRERHRMMIDILRLAGSLGVEFAFPTQTVHLTREGEAEPAREAATHQTGQAMRDGRLSVRRLTADAEWRREKPGPYRFTHSASSGEEDGETQIESRVGGDA